jgi:uncharacterized protein (TIGR02001 family)
MKLSQGVAAILLMAAGSVAHAEVTSTFTLTNDYNWRGITQSTKNPALQASVDYAHSSGFYAGAWGSNVDFGDDNDANLEVDLYLGFAGGETITYDVGMVWYTYPSSNGDALDFPEFHAGIGYRWAEAKVHYTSNFGGTSEQAWYYELNGAVPLPADFSLDLHAGYSDGDGVEASYGQDNYFDWSVGVSYTMLDRWNLSLKWVDGSDLETLDGTPGDVFTSEATVVFSIATTFPWAKE